VHASTWEHALTLTACLRAQEEEFKVAFYFALRDTLVANNLDQATQVAYEVRKAKTCAETGADPLW